MLLNSKIETLPQFTDASDACNYLLNYTLRESSLKSQQIVIILDAIDQLDEHELNLYWMAFDLPKNIKIIYTIRDTHSNVIQNIKQKLENTSRNTLKIVDIDFDTSIKQLKQRLNLKSRDLQPIQWNLIKKCLHKTEKIYPLHIKLLYDICVKWRSSQQPAELNNIETCTSIKETIKYMFKNFEIYYGSTLFSRCIFYLTIFKYGISESELEDILSIDDDVLNEIFDKHEAVLRRFPFSIWLRIKNDLNEYLIEHRVDDAVLIAW